MQDTLFWCRIHLRFRKGRCSTVERDVSASRGCDQSQDRTRNHSNAPSTTRWPLSKPKPMTGRVNVFTTELVTDVFYIFNSTVVEWTCYVLFLFCANLTGIKIYCYSMWRVKWKPEKSLLTCVVQIVSAESLLFCPHPNTCCRQVLYYTCLCIAVPTAAHSRVSIHSTCF